MPSSFNWVRGMRSCLRASSSNFVYVWKERKEFELEEGYAFCVQPWEPFAPSLGAVNERPAHRVTLLPHHRRLPGLQQH